MLDLPTDVQLLILEHIRSKADQKSLCLTSKAIRYLALPTLYHTVHLRTWDSAHRHLVTFVKSVAAGAGCYLRYTRNLCFEDVQPPAEPDSVQTGPFDFDARYDRFSNRELSARDEYMYLVMEMFPDHCLHTFRFLSERSLSPKIFYHLERTQQKIRHLHVNWSGAAPTVPCIYNIAKMPLPALQSLDIQFTSRHGITSILNHLFSNGSALKRLSLGRRYEGNRGLLYHCMQKMRASPKLGKLRELSLTGFDVGQLYSILATKIDFHQLLALSISRCKNADTFFQDLGSGFSGQPSQLQRLFAAVFEDSSIGTLLDHSPNLISLHLVWERGRPKALWDRLDRIGPRLRSLGMHRADLEPGMDAIGGSYEDIRWQHLFEKCPNTRQFGYQLSEHDVDPTQWDCNGGLEKFLEKLKYMPDLCMMHFRYSRCTDVDSDEGEEVKRQREVTFELQRFANAFFHYMDTHSICPNLNALAIGMSRGPKLFPESNEHHVPRHCFIKGHQTDVMNRKTTIAVSVPAYKLRQYEPEADILDLDPECE